MAARHIDAVQQPSLSTHQSWYKDVWDHEPIGIISFLDLSL